MLDLGTIRDGEDVFGYMESGGLVEVSRCGVHEHVEQVGMGAHGPYITKCAVHGLPSWSG